MTDDRTYIHLVADGGHLVLRESLPDGLDHIVNDWYANLGGQAFFERLAVTFYELVSQDEVLRPLFHGKWSAHAHRLAQHYKRMYGDGQLDAAWDPRLLAAHARVTISHEHRRRWLALFVQAGKRIQAPEPAFSELVSVTVIAASSLMGASRGAAIARGEALDRRGPAP